MPRPRLAVLAALFAASGAAGLLIEQSFEKLISTLVGGTTHAAATVLAVYFAGLTVGALAHGRFVRKRAAPLRVYAGAEAVVALWGLAIVLLYDQLVPVMAPLLALGVGHFWLLQSLRVVVAAIWILPATVPMGMTFPAVVDAIGAELGGEKSHGRAMSFFYGANLIGGIAAAAFAPYVAFLRWGVDGTVFRCALMQLGVAAAAVALSRRAPVVADPPPSAAAPESRRAAILLAAGFASGFLFFALEVVWTHLIATVIGSSAYAFAMMLAIVLTGLAIGSAGSAIAFPRSKRLPVLVPAIALIDTGLVLALTFTLWPKVPHALATLGGSLDSFRAAETLRWQAAAFLLLPVATIAGLVFPLLFRIDAFEDGLPAVLAGRLVAANSVGCVLGAMVASFVLLPGIGSERSLTLLALLSIATGLALALAYADKRRGLLVTAVALLAAGFAWTRPGWNRLSLVSSEQVYFHPYFDPKTTTLDFFHEDSLGGITSVIASPFGENGAIVHVLFTNAKFQGSDGGEQRAQTGFALVPAAFTPHYGRALAIGLGTGRSAYVLAALGFADVDIAEISPGMVRAAGEHFSGINGRILENPHAHLVLEDGRNMLLLRKTTYDLITMEVSSIWFADSTNLYSDGFYRLAHRRLNSGGIFQQWIQLHHLGTEELLSAIETAAAEFRYVSFFVVGGQGILVASDEPQRVQPAFLDRLPVAAKALDLAPGTLPAVVRSLMASRALSPADTSTLSTRAPAPRNTDRNRWLEYASPRYNISSVDWRRVNITALARLSSFADVEVSAGAMGPLVDACHTITRDERLKQLGSEESPGAAPGESSWVPLVSPP